MAANVEFNLYFHHFKFTDKLLKIATDNKMFFVWYFSRTASQ